MELSEDLLALNWPDSFVVVYRDGTSERLLKGSGVCVTPPADEPDGFGAFSALIPKKHPQNQKQGYRKQKRCQETKKVSGANVTAD